MIDQDILDHSIQGKGKTDGFSIGKRGKAMFWMYDPTPNGYYKLYQQNEEGEILGVRYVDADKTIVTVWKNQLTPNKNKPQRTWKQKP
jgi:uncharacterized protein YcbX